MTILTTLTVLLTGDTTPFEKAMGGAVNSAQAAGQSMSSLGSALTTRVTAPLLAAGGAAVAFATQFNTGMANVASLGQEAAQAAVGWGPQVQDLAVTMGKSTSDMAEGLYNVVSAFGVADDSLEVLEINARAATAGLSTTTDAINLTSAVTKGYGDTSAAAAQKAADLALRTVQLGQTNFPQLAASIGSVVPLSSSLAVSQEALFGVMATATGVTGNAAEVSTQLRGVLQALLAPTADTTRLLADMGFESGKAAIETLGLQGTIDAIVSASEATGTPLQKYIGSIEGVTLAMALGGQLSDQLTEKTLAMADAAGATDDAFNAQTQGINAAGFAMQQLAVRSQVQAERLGNALAPALLLVLERLDPLIGFVERGIMAFTSLDPKIQLVIIGAVGLVTAIGPLLLIIGAMVTGFGVVSAALATVSAPIILLVGALGLLAVAFATNFGGIRQQAQAFVDFLVPLFQQALGLLLSLWDTHSAAILQVAEGLWAFVTGLVNLFVQNYSQSIQAVTAAVMQFWEQHGATLTAVATTLWNGISNTIGAVIAILQALIDAGLAAIEGDWRAFGENLRLAVDRLWEGIKGIFSTAATALVQLVSGLTGQMVNTFAEVDWPGVGRAIVEGIASGISAAVGFVADAARRAAQAALSAAKGFLEIRSPARKPREEVGKQFGAGVALGIGDSQRMVEQAVTGLVRPLPNLAVSGAAGVGGGVSAGGQPINFTFEQRAPILGVDELEQTIMEFVNRAVQQADARRRLR